jgi:hypothetical protein
MRLIGTIRRIVVVLRELEQLSQTKKNQLLTVCKFSIKNERLSRNNGLFTEIGDLCLLEEWEICTK